MKRKRRRWQQTTVTQNIIIPTSRNIPPAGANNRTQRNPFFLLLLRNYAAKQCRFVQSVDGRPYHVENNYLSCTKFAERDDRGCEKEREINL